MLILSLDTSASCASLALVSDEKILSQSTFMADRRLSVRLLPEILHLLQLAETTMDCIDLFSCSIGPGSFTGVRAGVATIQGLALSMGKPCVGFSSLSLLAMNHNPNATLVCAMLDARKNEIYAALFDCSKLIPVPLVNDCVTPVENFLDRIHPAFGDTFIFCGDGATRYREIIENRLGERAYFAGISGNIANAAHGAFLARNAFDAGQAIAPNQLLPVYLRPTDREYAKLDQQKKPRDKT